MWSKPLGKNGNYKANMYPWHKRKKLDAGTLPHHAAWLDAHPHRTHEWLRDRLREGFDVHHIDCDHGNNDPANLVLIEHADHMRLHGKPMIDTRRTTGAKQKKPFRYRRRRVAMLEDGALIWLAYGEQTASILAHCERSAEWRRLRLVPETWEHYATMMERLATP